MVNAFQRFPSEAGTVWILGRERFGLHDSAAQRKKTQGNYPQGLTA
jgi:hypothetical protein